MNDLDVAILAGVIVLAIGMTANLFAPLVARVFVTGWASLVTSIELDPDLRGEIRQERRTHVSEHFRSPSNAGHTSLELAVLLVVETVIGAPGDVWSACRRRAHDVAHFRSWYIFEYGNADEYALAVEAEARFRDDWLLAERGLTWTGLQEMPSGQPTYRLLARKSFSHHPRTFGCQMLARPASTLSADTADLDEGWRIRT